MDNQEIFNQIRELQKQRTLLSAQDTALVNKINELRDKIVLKNIKKGYYGSCKCIEIPQGSIKKLIGRELSWNDEPVELKEN